MANYGLAAIHADAAFAQGATGQGITVAVIDGGVDRNSPDLTANLTPLSTDVIPGRNAPNGEETHGHGTQVAGVVAASFNGQGTVGVAYKATLLGVRADTPGTCVMPGGGGGTCAYTGDNLALAIDYAVAHGARVINMSIVGAVPWGPAFEQALSRAAAAGVVVTAAAGNSANSDPDWPARYAIDPRYVGSVVAVGAADKTGALASFSNMAGVTAQDFLVAPGKDVVTNCYPAGCDTVQGTSFAAPHVAGALALLLQTFPNLSGPQAIDILLKTADDLGAPGPDPVYGRGMLDLARAFSPIGTMSVPMSSSRMAPLLSAVGSSMGAAFGDSVSRTSALRTVGFDSYRRMFVTDLAQGYPASRSSVVGGSAGPPVRDAQVEMSPSAGLRLRFTAGAAAAGLPEGVRDRGLGMTSNRRSDLDLEIGVGRLSLQSWHGQGGIAPPSRLAAGSDAFAAMAWPDQVLRASYDLGPLFLAAETGSGARSLPGFAALERARYAVAQLGTGHGRFSASISAGRLVEPQGPLGSLLPAGAAFSLPAETRFAMLHADWATPAGLYLAAEAGFGRTSASGDLMALEHPATSSTWRISAATACAGPADGCTRWRLELAQPVRIESGAFTALLADPPAAWDDPLVFSRRRFSAAPSGREIDLRLGLDRTVPKAGMLQLDLVAARDPGHVAGAPVALGVSANWSARF